MCKKAWSPRLETSFFHRDNARPHVERSIQNCLENCGWEALPDPPYRPYTLPFLSTICSGSCGTFSLEYGSDQKKVSKLAWFFLERQAGIVLLEWTTQIICNYIPLLLRTLFRKCLENSFLFLFFWTQIFTLYIF